MGRTHEEEEAAVRYEFERARDAMQSWIDSTDMALQRGLVCCAGSFVADACSGRDSSRLTDCTDGLGENDSTGWEVKLHWQQHLLSAALEAAGTLTRVDRQRRRLQQLHLLLLLLLPMRRRRRRDCMCSLSAALATTLRYNCTGRRQLM